MLKVAAPNGSSAVRAIFLRRPSLTTKPNSLGATLQSTSLPAPKFVARARAAQQHSKPAAALQPLATQGAFLGRSGASAGLEEEAQHARLGIRVTHPATLTTTPGSSGRERKGRNGSTAGG